MTESPSTAISKRISPRGILTLCGVAWMISSDVLRDPLREGGIVYVRALEPALVDMPRIYEFLAHFRSENAAAVLASCLESELLDTGAILEIRGSEVPIEGAAIHDALLGGSAIRPSPKKRR